MKTLKLILTASFIASAGSISFSVFSDASAHDGGAELDSIGCHYGRNHRDYHCHEGILEDMTFKSRGEAIRKYNRIRKQAERDDDGK